MLEYKILEYPSKIQSDYIVAVYPEVEQEIMKIYEKSGRKDVFAAQLNNRIRYLEEKKKNCIEHKQWFENYTGMDWLYSLKIKDTFHNFRLYFVFVNDQVILLNAFIEKRPSDIERAKVIAAERYKMVKNNME